MHLVGCCFNKWHVSSFSAMVISSAREVSRERAFESLIISEAQLDIPNYAHLPANTNSTAREEVALICLQVVIFVKHTSQL